MKKYLNWIFSRSIQKKEFSLDESFKESVVELAVNKSFNKKDQLKNKHQHFLRIAGDEYRKTPEYGFLSESFNIVPDALLKDFYRKKILKK